MSRWGYVPDQNKALHRNKRVEAYSLRDHEPPYWLRLYQGPWCMARSFLPFVDAEGNPIWRTVVRNYNDETIEALQVIMDTEYRILVEAGVSNPFPRTAGYEEVAWMGFVRNSDDPGMPRPILMTSALASKIDDLSRRPSIKDPTKLQEGPVILFDIIVDKENRKWTVKSDENQFANKVPVTYWQGDLALPESKIKEAFTEDERKAVKAAKGIEETFPYTTEEEIQELFYGENLWLDVGRRKKSGENHFIASE